MSNLNNLNQKNLNINRKVCLAENVIIVDGQPGCGKTMFSSIISSLDRVEILNYAFEIEFIARLYKMNKITKDAAIGLILMFADHKLYQTMMGRETNFRYSDISSVFNNPFPLRYFKRIFQSGDKSIPVKINIIKPILSLTTHDLLNYAEPVFIGFGKKLTFIEIIRHPLYMIKQQTINMKELTADHPRDVQVYFDYKGHSLPYFAHGWEQKFIDSNPVEKAIYNMEQIANKNHLLRDKYKKKYDSKILTIPFEKFVIDPKEFLDSILNFTKTKFTRKTKNVLLKQRIPRKKVADGIPLKIYKRYLWEQSQKGLDEKEEFISRKNWAIQMGASNKAITVLEKISEDYEKNL